MSKQTAVEWLVKIYLQTGKIDSFDINQAKAMEREQIMEAHNQGYSDGYRDNGNSPIDYYNETYGGDK
jgi:hypothetical protein